ncbi:phosphoribosyl transferase domain protein [Xylaria digitata]|nr:phosphoribosyl transferase domain protein [Xylaria digitata]
MATLNSLKQALKQKAMKTAKEPLSDAQYSLGFNILLQGSETYQDFIIPQLSQVMAPLLNSRTHISVLEIGPGPKSVLGYLPSRMKQKISEYAAFEPNVQFARSLEEWLYSPEMTESPLPALSSPPDIRQAPFVLDNQSGHNAGTCTSDENSKYDVILFCHSMYGMKPHNQFIERAIEMLDQRLDDGIVVVFHRHGTLDLSGLVCHQTTSFPTGVVHVPTNDNSIDNFSPFIAGHALGDSDTDKAVRIEWRKMCCDLGRLDLGNLLFSAPEVMMVFTKHATALTELTAHVPLAKSDMTVKNREARLHRPASIVRPTEIEHIQHCVQWAIKHKTGLTVLGGGHSGHCLWPSVVSVDMSAFDKIHILAASDSEEDGAPSSCSLVVVEAGCKTGDIIRETMQAGLTVPLGARPSVGGGLWLQGGIGHLARLHGLACDSIVGAVIVSVNSGQVFLVGHVPSQYRPPGAVRPEIEADLLWALKGAGTNFGIIVSVTLKAHAAFNYRTRNWVFPLGNGLGARQTLSDFDRLLARELPRNSSADAYLYCDAAQLRFGVTLFQSSTEDLTLDTLSPAATVSLGQEHNSKIVDGLGLFETEMYMSGMHGGHGGGKTSSFKRCLFLNEIGATDVADTLVAAIEARPSSLCYLHLLHGGGAVRDNAADATAFGCRDWNFACVITGVWPRNQDGTRIAQAAVEWVYDVAMALLPLSIGTYGADLGPDPRDIPLADKAFGPNLLRLSLLKSKLDSHRVLAYACPLPKAPLEPKLIILVAGESCAGKDYCAGLWASILKNNDVTPTSLTARVVSISDETKRAYAAATGADLDRLLHERAYKEQHRPALTTFFQDQVHKRPQLLEEHFMNVVRSAKDVDVLLITGMREEAPVAALSHLVPSSRLIEVHVQASEETRRARGQGSGQNDNDGKDKRAESDASKSKAMNYCPSFIFNNEATGGEAAQIFAEHNLLPFLHEDLQRLANMVRLVPDFPRQGIDFRHVLDISQQHDGLALCTFLLKNLFAGDWAKVGAIVCCEAGGFVFAPALALEVNVRLALIREAGKLPPPTFSVVKSSSHISSSSSDLEEKRIEIGQDILPKSAPVVVVDDVLATGKTLCAVLELLTKAGVDVEDITVMTVLEFPVHRGRQLLRERGFGRVNIKSLLVYGGA